MPKFKKEPITERLRRTLSHCLISGAEHLPNAKKGVLAWLQDVRSETSLQRNACPPNVLLTFDSIWICELLTIESFEKQIPRIMRLLESYKTRRFIPMGRSKEDLYSSLRSIKNNVHGTGWQNVGLVDLKDTDLEDAIDYIGMSLQTFHGGHIAIIFNIVPSDEFKRKVNDVVLNECPPSTVLQFPRWQNLFRGWWGSRTSFGESIKREMIQRLLISLKSEAARFLRKYTTGFFFSANEMIPSIELWVCEKKSHSASPPSKDKRPPFRSFWESVGLPERDFDRYREKSGTQSIYLSDSNLNDFSIKWLVDKSNIQLQSGYRTIESQIRQHVDNSVPDLISAWALRARLLDFIEALTEQRVSIFSKKRFSTRKLFGWIKAISSSKHSFKRLKEDMQIGDLVRHLHHSGLSGFYQKWGQGPTSRLTDHLPGNLKYLYKKADELFSSTEEFLHSSLSAITVKTNYVTQFLILWLTIITVLIGFISITSVRLCDYKKIRPLCDSISSKLGGTIEDH